MYGASKQCHRWQHHGDHVSPVGSIAYCYSNYHNIPIFYWLGTVVDSKCGQWRVGGHFDWVWRLDNGRCYSFCNVSCVFVACLN